MGIVWVPLPIKGVPLLGVPGKSPLSSEGYFVVVEILGQK